MAGNSSFSRPVVLGVLPFRLVAALGQQVHAAHQIAGIEVLRVDPGQQRHVLVLGPQGHGDLAWRPSRFMWLSSRQTKSATRSDAQRPAGAEIAEHPDHVGHAGEHHAAIGDGLGEIQRLAVDDEVDVAQDVQVEAGGGDDDVGLELLAGLQQDARFGEAVDLVGDHRGLAGRDALEQVAVRHEGDALAPGPVASA